MGGDKLIRDPCVIQGPEGKFHMVWTVSWNEKGIGYARSEDLMNWSEQKYIPVMEHEEYARNCWAPEVYFDEESKRYMIFWFTTIPGRFPETDDQGDRGLINASPFASGLLTSQGPPDLVSYLRRRPQYNPQSS